MVLHRDGAADALDLADRPVLVKGSSTLDGRLVHTAGAIDVVGAAIGLESAELGRAGRGVVGAVGLHNVVLDEGVDSPAVEGEVYVYVSECMRENERVGEEETHTAVDVVVVPGAVIGDGARGTWVPALTTNPVANVPPADLVGAAGAVVVVDRPLTVGPVRVKVAVVGALTRLDATKGKLKRAGNNGCRRGEGREDGGERDHFFCENQVS